jgi:hypothetical protein
MALLLTEMFDEVRELIGGELEAELEVRFPDSRIYKHYKHFKRELAKSLKQAELSVSSVTVPIASNFANLGLGDRHIVAAYLVAGTTWTELTPATAEYIKQATGQFNKDTGAPTHYWVEMAGTSAKVGTATVAHTSAVYSTLSSLTGDAIASTDIGKYMTIAGLNYLILSTTTVASNGTLPLAGTGVAWTINSHQQLVVYPQPTTAATIILQGSGVPVYEPVAYDSDGMLSTAVQSTIPELFEDACIEYMLWRIKRSAEEFTEQREMIAEAQYEKAIMAAKRRWGMVCPTSFWMKNNKAGVGPLE